MTKITTTISRDKLKLHLYEPDSCRIVKDQEITESTGYEDFYHSAVRLLSLMFLVQTI